VVSFRDEETLALSQALARKRGERDMANKKKTRGRKQDRARVAGGQDYEVRHASKKSGKSKAAVKSSKEGGHQPQARRTQAAAVMGQ
jgi:hypothetical protein